MARRDLVPGRQRTVLVYLAAIVAPSLVLLALSWQSVDRQRHAIETLTASNRLLLSARIASEVESRLLARSAACLKDPDLLRLATLVVQPESVDRMDGARKLAAALVERHPFAESVFVLDSAGPRYPYLQNPLPTVRPTLSEDAHAAEFERFFERAERLELADGQYGVAAALYEQCATLPVAPRAKALALARLARCQARLGRSADARRTWIALMRSHGDQRDLAFQPFGLAGALELKALEPDLEARATVEAAYDGLVSGRWSLGAKEVDFFAGALERILGRAVSTRPSTRFLDECRLARALDERGLRQASGRYGETSSATLDAAGEFHVLLTRVSQDGPVIGLRVSRRWLVDRLVRPTAAELGLPVSVDVRVGSEGPPGRPTSPDEVQTQPFPGLLAGFHLVVAPAPARTESAAAWQRWSFAGSTLLTLGVLAIGVLLLGRDAARQRETNRLRADLVSGVSHELKTPLTLIRVCAETLASEPVPADAERERFCGVITRETDRLTTLIDRVLSFSRVDRGERTYALVRGPIDAVVRETLGHYGEYLRRRGFTLCESLEPGLPEVAHDRVAVAEALVNLLDNAAKYSGDARHISVSLARRDGAVALEVADQGVGIDPADQARIFDRFYRSGQTLAKGGYGLGLFLVQHIVEAHGGLVELESTPGSGSRFRLVFPAAQDIQEG